MSNKEAKEKVDTLCNEYVGKRDNFITISNIMNELHSMLKDNVAPQDWIVSKFDRYGSSVIEVSGYGDLIVIHSNHMDFIYKIEVNPHVFNKLFPVPEEQLPSIESVFEELLDKYEKVRKQQIYDTCLFTSTSELKKLSKEIAEYKKHLK